MITVYTTWTAFISQPPAEYAEYQCVLDYEQQLISE